MPEQHLFTIAPRPSSGSVAARFEARFGIGLLHEAEDESQTAPELHDTIRAARKVYQQTGDLPP